MSKSRERELARELRQAGLPYKRIAAALGVSVSSAHAWTRDIELTAEQKAFNLRGPRGPQNPEHVRRRAESWRARCRQLRHACQEEGRSTAREGDALHLAGCMLYWAEGAKARNSIQFSNSDPRMVALFKRFLTDALGVPLDTILFSINVYTTNGLSLAQIERYWLDILDLPRANARKHMTNHAHL